MASIQDWASYIQQLISINLADYYKIQIIQKKTPFIVSINFPIAIPEGPEKIDLTVTLPQPPEIKLPSQKDVLKIPVPVPDIRIVPNIGIDFTIPEVTLPSLEFNVKPSFNLIPEIEFIEEVQAPFEAPINLVDPPNSNRPKEPSQSSKNSVETESSLGTQAESSRKIQEQSNEKNNVANEQAQASQEMVSKVQEFKQTLGSVGYPLYLSTLQDSLKVAKLLREKIKERDKNRATQQAKETPAAPGTPATPATPGTPATPATPTQSGVTRASSDLLKLVSKNQEIFDTQNKVLRKIQSVDTAAKLQQAIESFKNMPNRDEGIVRALSVTQITEKNFKEIKASIEEDIKKNISKTKTEIVTLSKELKQSQANDEKNTPKPEYNPNNPGPQSLNLSQGFKQTNQRLVRQRQDTVTDLNILTKYWTDLNQTSTFFNSAEIQQRESDLKVYLSGRATSNLTIQKLNEVKLANEMIDVYNSIAYANLGSNGEVITESLKGDPQIQRIFKLLDDQKLNLNSSTFRTTRIDISGLPKEVEDLGPGFAFEKYKAAYTAIKKLQSDNKQFLDSILALEKLLKAKKK